MSRTRRRVKFDYASPWLLLPNLRVTDKKYHRDWGRGWDYPNIISKTLGRSKYRATERELIHKCVSAEDPDEISNTIRPWKKVVDRWYFD